MSLVIVKKLVKILKLNKVKKVHACTLHKICTYQRY